MDPPGPNKRKNTAVWAPQVVQSADLRRGVRASKGTGLPSPTVPRLEPECFDNENAPQTSVFAQMRRLVQRGEVLTFFPCNFSSCYRCPHCILDTGVCSFPVHYLVHRRNTDMKSILPAPEVGEPLALTWLLPVVAPAQNAQSSETDRRTLSNTTKATCITRYVYTRPS